MGSAFMSDNAKFGEPNRYLKFVDDPVYETLNAEAKKRISYYFQGYLVGRNGEKYSAILNLQDIEKGVQDISEVLGLDGSEGLRFIDSYIKPQMQKLIKELNREI